MDFIIKETGEEVSVHYMTESGCDDAKELAYDNGFDESKFVEDEDTGALIGPKEEVDYWVEFFNIYNNCEGELDWLKKEYDADEVDNIFWDEMPEFDIESFEAAVNATADILRKRYDIKAARLISSNSSGLPTSDFGYWEESLYQREDGSYFLVGDGGPMTKYGKSDGCGGITYGNRSYSISAKEAKAWIAKYGDGENL